MKNDKYKEICEFIINAYGEGKEPIPYEEDYDNFISNNMINVHEQSYCIGHIDGQTAGISRVIERMEQMIKRVHP